MANILHLGYHYVRDGKAPGPNCSPARLRTHIEALEDERYKIMTCEEVGDRLQAGFALPEKHATLSFDDGLKDQYTTAFPILKEMGVRATFFYTTCSLDGKLPPVIGFQILIELLGAERLEKDILPAIFRGTPYLDLLDPKRYDASDRKKGEAVEMRRIKWMFNHWAAQSFKQEKMDEMFAEYVGDGSQERYAREWFMTADELREMAGLGMEIASHTVTHPALDVTGLKDIEEELRNSKDRLQEVIPGRSVKSFAWTFGGQFRKSARDLAGKFYSSGWNFLSGLTEMPRDPYQDVTDIPRINEMVFLPTVPK